jgi:hypothetical protein
MAIIFKEFIEKIGLTGKECIDGRTVQYMKANFYQENVMDWVS